MAVRAVQRVALAGAKVGEAGAVGSPSVNVAGFVLTCVRKEFKRKHVLVGLRTFASVRVGRIVSVGCNCGSGTRAGDQIETTSRISYVGRSWEKRA